MEQKYQFIQNELNITYTAPYSSPALAHAQAYNEYHHNLYIVYWYETVYQACMQAFGSINILHAWNKVSFVYSCLVCTSTCVDATIGGIVDGPNMSTTRSCCASSGFW